MRNIIIILILASIISIPTITIATSEKTIQPKYATDPIEFVVKEITTKGSRPVKTRERIMPQRLPKFSLPKNNLTHLLLSTAGV